MKKMLQFIIILMFTFLPSFGDEGTILPSQLGLIQDVMYEDLSGSEVVQTRQVAEVKLLKNDLKGNVVIIENMLTGNPYYDITLKKGMKVIIHVESTDNGLEYSIEDIHRSNILIWLSLLFCGLLIYVGKKKGLYSLVSIVLTCFLIFNCLSPMILHGINAVLGTVLICLISTAVTMYLVGGFNKKSTAAMIGCVLSLIIAGTLSFLTVKVAHLTGFSGENAMFLYSAHPELDFVSIVVSTMMLATLGAVMDVAMSIASTVNEIFETDNTKSVKELFVSGMNVGRDIIGTMANTLILVYLGGSLPLLLLASNIDMQKFFNLNQVVTEISSAIIGSCAIVICVPVTAIVASELVKRIRPKYDFENIG